MGRQKYLKEIKELVKSPVISYKSIQRKMLSRKHLTQYPKQLIRNLIKKGRLKQLAKGYYTDYDDISLAVFCFQPAYLGLQDALSYHSLWEQETIPVIITTRKVRNGLRTIMGKNILIHRIDPAYYFGLEYKQEGNFALPYSDIEKTLIDMIHFKQKIDSNTIKEFKKRIDSKKLKEYLKKYPTQTMKRVNQLVF